MNVLTETSLILESFRPSGPPLPAEGPPEVSVRSRVRARVGRRPFPAAFRNETA